MTHLISYTLHKPGKDYSKLYEAIKSVTGTWWHHTTSVWLVSGTISSEQIYKHLAPHIDLNDELMVFKLSGEWYGRSDDTQGITWMNARSF